MMRHMLVFAAILAIAAANASASGAVDPFDGVLGTAIGEEEAAALDGGDVHITLNAERTRLKVEVSVQKDKDRGHKIAGSERSYEIVAHNRVVDTKTADFMPAGDKPAALKDQEKLTSKPEQFPAGTWKVTAVKERTDKFGPNIVNTNAVGKVEVFDKNGNSLGRYNDTGYAIHSNTNDFNSS